MRKIAVVVGSRANYARIRSVLHAISEHPQLKLQLIVSASALLSRFGRAAEIIEDDGYDIDHKIYSIIEGESPITMAKSAGLGIVELASAFENLEPDIVLTVADRFETISTAVAASFMNIAIAHTQGGEITGTIDESVRHSVTKLSHIHFPSTEESYQRIIQMGEDPSAVFNVGCPSIDLVLESDLSADPQTIMDKPIGVGDRLDMSKPYLVVMQHPVTTEYGESERQIDETLLAVRRLDMQTIMFWPNVDAGAEEIARGIRRFREKHGDMGLLHYYINLPPEDYLIIMNSASCLIGNSSSFIREGAFLGIPAVNVGSRQAFRERGKNIVDVPHSADKIYRATQTQLKHKRYEPDMIFGNGGAGAKIAEILSVCEINIQKRNMITVEKPSDLDGDTQNSK